MSDAGNDFQPALTTKFGLGRLLENEHVSLVIPDDYQRW
jgi:hypothetical protein